MVIKEILYKHLANDDRLKQFEGEYWPSQIWNCLRRQYYDRLYPTASGAEAARFTLLGETIHELVADILKREPGIKIFTEVPVRIPHPTNNEIVISGRADDLIIVEFTNERYLVEVKTVSDLRSKVERGYLPRLDHRAQLNLYMRAFPKSKGVLFYIDRADFDAEEFQISFDQDLYNKTLQRVESLHRALNERNVPEPEAKKYSDMSWQCSYCVHKARCDRELKGD